MHVPPKLRSFKPAAVTLSGGGSRLYGHLGVLLAMRDLNIPVVSLSGVSGGAIVAAAVACLGIDRAIELITHFPVKRAMKWGWLRNLGLYDNREVAAFARENGITWEAAKARGIELRIGVTALEPGVSLVWTADDHPEGVDLAEALRISSSIPLVWGYTRMPTSLLNLPPLPPEAVLPPVLTLTDGGLSELMLPGAERTWVASNVAFNGYRATQISGLVDYLAQMLSVLQYRAMDQAIDGASCVIRHRSMRAFGWLDQLTPEGIATVIEGARLEATAELLQAMKE